MASREELELRKLELEVRELERSPWLRPAYLAALLPIVLATLGFLSAWMAGYFSDERAKLKQDTAQLKLDRDAQKQGRDEMQLKFEEADAIVTRVRNTIDQIERERAQRAGASPSPTEPSN
jgi:hypothetical protein